MNNVKVNTWEDMKVKYGENREQLSLEEEREFVNDCFNLYEREGFAEIFNTPYEDKSNVGKKFIVLSRQQELIEDSENGCDLECLPCWHIQFEDGADYYAYPEEIIPSEIIPTR